MKQQQKRFADLMKKVESLKRSGTVDLSTEEDLSIAVMNLVSLEEHLFFTGVKVGKHEYFDLLDEVRRMRKELLGQMIDRHEGETWCISKHLLGLTMRLMEVGTKLHADGRAEEAMRIFSYAHRANSFFWALRLRLMTVEEFKKEADKKPWTLEEIVNKLVNCCDE